VAKQDFHSGWPRLGHSLAAVRIVGQAKQQKNIDCRTSMIRADLTSVAQNTKFARLPKNLFAFVPPFPV
jgi:hypothetical protein